MIGEKEVRQQLSWKLTKKTQGVLFLACVSSPFDADVTSRFDIVILLHALWMDYMSELPELLQTSATVLLLEVAGKVKLRTS